MNQELKKQYQWFQVLIFALQLEKWPLEEAISRDEAFAEVVRFASILGIKVEPGDPEFLPTVAGEIARLLILPPEQPAPNIPKNLQELVEIYEKHLKEEKGRRTARLPLSQQILQEQIKNQLVAQFEPLKQNRELAGEVSFNLSNQVVVNLPPVAIEVAFKKEDYQSALEEIEPEVEHELKQAGVKPEPEKIKAIEKNLVETTFEQAQNLAATPREKILEEGPPKITPEKGKVFKAEEELERKIGAEFQTSLKILPLSFQESQKLNRTTKELIISHLLELPKEEITQENYEKLLRKVWPRIQEELEKKGLSFSQTRAEGFIKEFVKKTQLEATILTTTAPRPFSEEVATRLEAEEEGVAFWPAYPLSQPKLIWAYFKRAIFGPPKKVLEIAASEATPEWQEMIEKGLFAEDIGVSISALKQMGLPETHPTILKLKDKQAQILAAQKTEEKDKPAVRILKSYHEFPKLAGRHQIYEPETRMYLPRLSPPPLKGRLEQFLNQIGLVTRLYQRIKLAPGKTVIRPYLSERLMLFITHYRFSSFSHLLETIYRKTFGQIIAALAKTGVGRVIKEGIKKAATWIATRLGIEAGIMAAGVAGAGPTAGVSLLIAAAINLAIEIGGKILGKIWEKIKSIIHTLVKEPEKALAAIGAGIAAVVFLPMPIALIGVVPIVLGGIGLISVSASSVGAIASGLAANVTAFFAILTTAPFAAPIAGLVIAIIGTLAALTFFIVITTAGAFIVPIEPTKPVTAYFEVTKNVDRNEVPNDELQNKPCVTYTVTVKAQQPIIITSVRDERSVSCTGGRTPDVETPIDIPHPTTPIKNWTSDPYTLCFDDSFADCRVCNTVTVTANVPEENKTGEMASDRQCVKIGKPPEDCPEGWPTTHGRILQGPNANYSHPSQEAIDIGSFGGFIIFGQDVYATHQGQVILSETYSCGGGIVKIEGTCNGKTFVSKFVHLKTRKVPKGKEVNRDDLIGTVGGDSATDSCSDGPHLHYEFIGLEMEALYIPIQDDILEGCCLSVPLCPTNCEDLNVNW